MLLPSLFSSGWSMRPRHFLIVVLVIAAASWPCLGQMSGGPNPTSFVFQINGIVRDGETNRAIGGVRVNLLNMGTPQAFALTTTEGQFTFSGVRNGRYDIQINTDGFNLFDQGVTIDRGSAFVMVELKKSEIAAPTAPGASVSVHQLGVPAKAQKEFEKACDLMSGKTDYQGAIDEFDRAIQDYPDYYEAYAMESAAYLALSDAAAAEKALRKSIDLSAGKDPVGLYLLAGLLNSTGRYLEAEGPARQCIALDASSWHGYFELARALLGLGDLEGAQESALEARSQAPDNPRIILLVANIHGALRDYAAYLQDLDSYLALNPPGPMAGEVRKTRDQVQQALAGEQPASAPASQPRQ
jgi:hypothetical protein